MTHTVDQQTDWQQIARDARFLGDLRSYGITWFFAGLYRTRDAAVHELMTLGELRHGIFAGKRNHLLEFAFKAVWQAGAFTITEQAKHSSLRMVRTPNGDIIVVEYEKMHGKIVGPEEFVQQVVSRLSQISTQNP